MKKILAVLAILGVSLAVAGTAGAHHRTPALHADPGFTVTVGTNVTLTATAIQGTEPEAAPVGIAACRASDATPMPKAACDATEAEATWVVVVAQSDSPGAHIFSSSVPGDYGFRAFSQHGQWATQFDAQNVTVNPAPNNEAQRHAGCKGVENAKSKVSNNGNANAALDAVAERLRCDAA